MNYFQKQRSFLGGWIRTETCMMGEELYHQYEFGKDDCGFSFYRKTNLDTMKHEGVLLTICYKEDTWAYQIWPL